MILQWFDQWLKGEEATFVPEGNTVRYFQMRESVWKEASSSNFSVFDRNLDSTVSPALGTQHDARKAVQHASYLVLPAVGS